MKVISKENKETISKLRNNKRSDPGIEIVLFSEYLTQNYPFPFVRS